MSHPPRGRRTERFIRTGAASAALTVLLVVAACESTPSDPDVTDPPVQLLIVSGSNQSGPVNEELPEPLVVRAVDGRGRPLNHLVVSFVPTMGGGRPWAGAANTDPQGYAREYWMLGPEPGENRMEARLVNPATGEKLTLGTFIATAFEVVAPSPEVCDGVDNDQDGGTDENLAYCFGGQPAPNTDGAVCTEGFLDLNVDPTDGCEVEDLIDGRYALDVPIDPQCSREEIDLRLEAFELTRIEAGTIRVTFEWQSPFGTLLEAELPFDESTLGFAGAGSFSWARTVDDGVWDASGDYTLDLAQTSPGVIEGTVSLTGTISLTIDGQTAFCMFTEMQAVRATLQ